MTLEKPFTKVSEASDLKNTFRRNQSEINRFPKFAFKILNHFQWPSCTKSSLNRPRRTPAEKSSGKYIHTNIYEKIYTYN